jgi:hypothetical protein
MRPRLFSLIMAALVSLPNQVQNDFHNSIAYLSAQSSAGRQIWVYSSDSSRAQRSQPAPSLSDFIVVLEKNRTSTSSSRYKYQISVLGDNLREIETALMTIVISEDVDVDLNSLRTLTRPNIPGRGILQNILARKDTGWQDLAVQTPMIEWSEVASKKARDLVGLLPFVGKGSLMTEGISDLYNLIAKDAKDISPSPSFITKLRDVNRYDTHSIGAMKLRRSRLTTTDLVYGVRFEVVVDESVDEPEFFILAKNLRSLTIGIEIGADKFRPYVTSTAQPNQPPTISQTPSPTPQAIKIGLVDNSRNQYQDGCGCGFWPVGKEPKFDDPRTAKYILIGNYFSTGQKMTLNCGHS